MNKQTNKTSLNKILLNSLNVIRTFEWSHEIYKDYAELLK